MWVKIYTALVAFALVSCGQAEISKRHLRPISSSDTEQAQVEETEVVDAPPTVVGLELNETLPTQFGLVSGLARRIFSRQPKPPVGHQPTTEILAWDSPEVLRTPIRMFYQGRPKLISVNRSQIRAAKEVNILVHGINLAGPTLAGKLTWNHPTSNSYQAIEATGGQNLTFLWSGVNSISDRRSAGIVLGRNIFDLAGTGKTVNIWSHSHGGNVAREAIKEFDRLASIYQRTTGKSLTMGRVVTIGTPFRPEHDIPGQRLSGPLQRVRYYANVGAAADWVVKWGGNFGQLRHWSTSPYDYRANVRYKVPGSHNAVVMAKRRFDVILASLQSDPYF